MSLSDLSSGTSSEAEFSGGLSDPNSTHYRRRRNVLDIVNTLQSHGLQHILDLPQIAVLGSQSVGKSSLIEAIARITLPRAKGTCTRCPIECRLSKVSDVWSCQVYLRRASQIHEIEFGPTIIKKSEVEDRIRRAQAAILNPSKPIDDFLNPSVPLPPKNERSFSSDTISVRIAGRDMDDLSFVDLPGIIQSVRDGDNEEDITEVKKLVENYIRKPGCLILLVVSCEMDLENQGARQLAKQVDPTGERTMPVLTKPDRIDLGQHSTWIELVNNQREKSKYGWHVVKQANQMELESGLSRETAHDSIRSRLGTPQLAQSLGTILFGLICKRLPGLLKEIEVNLKRTKGKLAKLPPKVEGDPIPAVYNLVDMFKREVSQLVEGRPDDGECGLIQKFREFADQFGEIIFSQAPCFRPYNAPSPSSDAPSEDTGELGPINGQEDGLEPSGRRDPATFVYIDEALQMAKNARTRELPKNTPFAVKKSYIRRFTDGWGLPADDVFKQVQRTFSQQILDLIKEHFSRFSHGGLESTVLHVVRSHFENCSLATEEKIKDCVALERKDHFSSNWRDLEKYKDQYMQLYTEARREHKKATTGQEEGMLASLMEFLTASNMDTYKDALARVIFPDKANQAIEIIAEVRAYYQVAYKRFADYVPMIIDRNLLQGFDDGLIVALTKGLNLGEDGSSERCTPFLQEDPDVEHERDSLRRTLERFDSARTSLQSIPGVPFMVDAETAHSEPDVDRLAE